MNLKKKKMHKKPGENLDLSMDYLRGKQSVRATFRLPNEVIDLLSVIAGQLGIKQKSLFDQLVENPAILGQVAEEARNYRGDEKTRRQKTFVISRNSLVSLDDIARQEQIPRDVLVEISIKRLLPVIESELDKHEKRKILLKEMKTYLGQGKKLLGIAGNLLGKGDRFYVMIDNQVKLCEKNVAAINSLIEKGKPMEEW